jgi:hypothetical protein
MYVKYLESCTVGILASEHYITDSTVIHNLALAQLIRDTGWVAVTRDTGIHHHRHQSEQMKQGTYLRILPTQK